MKNTWKWAFGIALAVIILLIVPFAWGLFLPYGEGGMMGYRYGSHMPMMYGGFGMFFMWLILLASLVLIGLGIAWLVKALTSSKQL